jgi:hypothetical protein
MYGSIESRQISRMVGRGGSVASAAVVWLAAFALVAMTVTFMGDRSSHSTELLSRSASQHDLDSFFNGLDSDGADDSEAKPHAWSGMDATTRNYIENKRKALHSNGGFTSFDKSGHAVSIREKWSSAAARLQSDALISSKEITAASPKRATPALYSMAELAKMQQAAQAHYLVYKKEKKVYENSYACLSIHSFYPQIFFHLLVMI